MNDSEGRRYICFLKYFSACDVIQFISYDVNVSDLVKSNVVQRLSYKLTYMNKVGHCFCVLAMQM